MGLQGKQVTATQRDGINHIYIYRQYIKKEKMSNIYLYSVQLARMYSTVYINFVLVELYTG